MLHDLKQMILDAELFLDKAIDLKNNDGVKESIVKLEDNDVVFMQISGHLDNAYYNLKYSKDTIQAFESLALEDEVFEQCGEYDDVCEKLKHIAEHLEACLTHINSVVTHRDTLLSKENEALEHLFNFQGEINDVISCLKFSLFNKKESV